MKKKTFYNYFFFILSLSLLPSSLSLIFPFRIPLSIVRILSLTPSLCLSSLFLSIYLIIFLSLSLDQTFILFPSLYSFLLTRIFIFRSLLLSRFLFFVYLSIQLFKSKFISSLYCHCISVFIFQNILF
jgi:hypothetical protein